MSHFRYLPKYALPYLDLLVLVFFPEHFVGQYHML